MARYDKYEPKAGGFRARLAADLAAANVNVPLGVGLDVNGRVVIGAGNSGIVGVLVLTRALRAGDVVDVMTDGELVEFGGVAGSRYYARRDTGVLTTAADTGGAAPVPNDRVGQTVEGDRLVVRVRTAG